MCVQFNDSDEDGVSPASLRARHSGDHDCDAAMMEGEGRTGHSLKLDTWRLESSSTSCRGKRGVYINNLCS